MDNIIVIAIVALIVGLAVFCIRVVVGIDELLDICNKLLISFKLVEIGFLSFRTIRIHPNLPK